MAAAVVAAISAAACLAAGCATGEIAEGVDASSNDGGATDAGLVCDACADGQVCSNGKCSSTCASGQTACSGNCVDTKTDSKNCGGCGKACGAGLACTAGNCVCASPTLGCAPTADASVDAAILCVDPRTDIDNCGACGNACTDGGANALPGCVDGGCGIGACVTSFGDCDKVATDGCEVNLSNDKNNCGTCGLVCDGGAPSCRDGGCVTDPCGNGIVDTGERCDGPTGVPAGGQIACYAPGTKNECKLDFSKVPQLYCNGTCTWAGAQGCDQADADIYCKLITGSSTSTASSFTTATAQAVGGFSCPNVYGTNLGTFPEYGVNVNVWYQSTSILGNHGAGTVISGATCTP